MDDRSGLVPWTDSQWSQVNRVITEDASKARVAASVLPVFGSLPRSTEVIPRERLQDDGTVDDVDTIQLLELSVEVKLSRQQVEEEDLGSALLLFRWAANLIARTEDWVIFNGMPEPYNKPAFVHIAGNGDAPPPRNCQISGGRMGVEGLLSSAQSVSHQLDRPGAHGEDLVPLIVEATGELEQNGYLAPFAVFLANDLFRLAYKPANGSLVLPRDRIEPFVGGPLLRSSALPESQGLVVSLAGDPVDIVVAVDASAQFLYIDRAARYVFRVYERLAPRIKDPLAVVQLRPERAPAAAKGPEGLR